MKKEEVIEIADAIYGEYPWPPVALERLHTLCNEVERRTLERAAVVCEEESMRWPPSRDFSLCAAAIRALKELK